MGIGAGLLGVLVCGATLAIWTRDPLADSAYECGIFLLAAAGMLRMRAMRRATAAPLAALAVWGFAQLALGATLYRWATLEAALRMAGFAATAVAARAWLAEQGVRERFLRLAAVFGAVVAVAGVLAYHSSPGRILWLFPAPYPDVWGVFLSRNHFAQFLEVLLPVALWCALRRAAGCYLAAAVMLAAGIASASRAGAVLLVAETVVVFLLARRGAGWKPWSFAAAVVALAAVWGGDYLLGRFGQPDPYRPQIFVSARAMIAAHPWRGTGLGTFAEAYPAYASFDAGRRVEHAHSDWLEWAAEGGAGFAAVWLVLAAGIAPAAIDSVWGLGVLAVFLHALVDYPFARLGVAAWVFVLVGALAGSGGGKLRREIRTRRPTYWKEKKVNLRTVQSVLALAMSVNLGLVVAASPVIGTVMAKGAFRVDNATVSGNATLFEGSTLETDRAASSVALASGARLWLASASRGKLYGDRLVLEKGQTRLDQGTGFRLEALGLTIQPERTTSTGRVALRGAQRVEVAALTGSFRVLNARGQLVANLAAGSALSFEPQGQQSNATRVTGCLEARNGRYLVTDEVTNVSVEVAGAGLAGETGNRVELTGQMDPTATPLSGTSQLIRVSQVRRVARGCGNNAAAAAAAAAGGAAGGAATGGISAATIAIIGGVTAAATLGGLAAADALPGQGEDNGTPPAISR